MPDIRLVQFVTSVEVRMALVEDRRPPTAVNVPLPYAAPWSRVRQRNVHGGRRAAGLDERHSYFHRCHEIDEADVGHFAPGLPQRRLLGRDIFWGWVVVWVFW